MRAPFPLANACGPSPVPVFLTAEADESIIQVNFDLPLLLNVGFDIDNVPWTITRNGLPLLSTQATIIASNQINVSADASFSSGDELLLSFAGSPDTTYSPDCPLAPFTDFPGEVP